MHISPASSFLQVRDGCKHSRQSSMYKQCLSSTGLQFHPPIHPPIYTHTYTQTHLKHGVCPVSVLWQCMQLYSSVVLPSCCVSLLSNSAFTQLFLTFLPPLLLCPPTARPVGGGACSSWPGRDRLTDSGPHEPSWPDFLRTFYTYRKSRMLFVGKSGR